MREQLCLPHPDTIHEWCASVDCSPGFLKDVIISISNEARKDKMLQDCNLLINTMAIGKQKGQQKAQICQFCRLRLWWSNAGKIG